MSLKIFAFTSFSRPISAPRSKNIFDFSGLSLSLYITERDLSVDPSVQIGFEENLSFTPSIPQGDSDLDI